MQTGAHRRRECYNLGLGDVADGARCLLAHFGVDGVDWSELHRGRARRFLRDDKLDPGHDLEIVLEVIIAGDEDDRHPDAAPRVGDDLALGDGLVVDEHVHA